jgi:hypothetical protein
MNAGMDQMSTVPIIMNAAIFSWLGFYLPVDLNRVGLGKNTILTMR